MLGVTREHIDKWLMEHRRELSDPEFYYGVDNNEDSVDKFTSDRLKVLCVFLSPGKNRAVSNTFNALNWLCHEKLGDKVFVDNCYFPNDPDIPLIKGNIPFMFGNVSHAPVTEYDVVLVACCVMPEVLNVPHLLENSGVPLTIQEREKVNTPLIVWGGAASSESAIVLGPIQRDGKDIGNSLVDMAIYGYGEHVLPDLVEKLYEYKQSMNLKDKKAVKERLISDNVLHDNIFYPEKYQWVYDTDRFTIKEIKKLDDRLPDRVRFNTIHWNDFRGFPLKAFNLTGENADSHDIMISSGCSGQSSCCAFDRPDYIRVPIQGKGLVQLKELVGGTYYTDKYLNSDQEQKVESVKSVRTTNLVKLYLSDGSVVDTTAEHQTVRINYGTCDSEVVQVRELKPGDDMQIKLGTGCFGTYQSVDNQVINEEFAELLGFIQGDGSVTDRTKNQVFMFCKDVEDSHYGSLFKKYLDSSVEKKLQYTCKDGTPIYRYYSNDKDAYNLLISIGVTDGKVNRVPDVIFKSPKTVIQSYLRGIFQADGWSSSTQVDDTKRGTIGLTSVSFDYLQDVQLLLRMVGIYSQVSFRTIDYRSDGCNRQKSHYIFLRTEWANKFKEEVGFLDKNNESFGYKNWRNIPSKMLRQLIKSERHKLPQDKLRTIDDQLSFGALSLQSLRIIYTSGIKLPRIYVAIAEGNYYPVKVVKVVYTDTPVNTCSTLVTPNHKMCYGMLYESNCMEATVASRYEERDLDDLERDMAYVRRTAAPNTISWFSFNLNYYKHFMDLLGKSSDYFKGVTLLNERLDVVANAPEQLALAKRLGLKRFSGAIEGMGERVREKILNKNLPKETLFKAVKVVSSLGLMHFKAGLIATGQETEEDIQDFISEIDEMIRIRDEAGAHHSYQFNVTPLVIYSQIALRYLPRITAKNSFLSVRNMQTLIKACQERNIRIKFNGRGCGTWLEQLLLDFGPGGTDWLVGVTLDKGLIYERNFGDKAKEAAVAELSKRDYDPLFFIEERPNDWIFPNDHIKYADEKLIKMWQDRHAKNDYSVPLCLKTPASLNPKCYNCGACFTPKEKADMLTRKVEDKMTLNEVIEKLSDSRHVDTVRVVAKMDSNWDIYNRESLCHYLTAQFLQESPLIEKGFYAVGKTSTTWLSNNGQKGWFGGSFAWDIQLKERVPIKEFQNAIENINKRLKSCQILRVFPDCKELPVKRESVISFIGETDKYSMSILKDKLSVFNWDIKVAVKSMGGQLDTEARHMPELKERVLFVPKGNKILIYMSLPASVNPYLVMSSILGKGYEKMLVDFRFNILDQGIEVDSSCSCGKHLTYSIMTGKQKVKCPVCEGKFILAKLTGRI